MLFHFGCACGRCLEVTRHVQVHVMGALPLRNLSRVWGYLNSVELPVWFRPMGFTVYSWIFGCNLDEIERDLKTYTSLGDFFYRRLKDGARPSADTVLVSDLSPAAECPFRRIYVLYCRSVLQTEQFSTLVRSRVVV